MNMNIRLLWIPINIRVSEFKESSMNTKFDYWKFIGITLISIYEKTSLISEKNNSSSGARTRKTAA
jgi:hypothetical protein